MVKIPPEFVDFMRDVNRLITEKDESATLESDDLLQCESSFGGLIEAGADQYGFTYFPEDGVRLKWEVVLDRSSIEKISNGTMTSLELWKCKDPACRCAFFGPEDDCFYCDWVEAGNEGTVDA